MLSRALDGGCLRSEIEFEQRCDDRSHARIDRPQPLARSTRPERMRIVHLNERADALGNYVELQQ
jgi:hypothetical protein